MTMRKGFKVIGAVFLFFILAVVVYLFTPFLALIMVSMQSVTALLVDLAILLAFLAIVKLLLQVLTGKKIQIRTPKVLRKLMNRLKRKPA
ncbi:hypothetical protein P7D73_06750 [Enterococcus raffinosus]|uniref:hypothetical protein n=1 Tax=Enterococcus raffinosus TaxID=71452 RepID=UPI0028917858|nr:hypothetical protein [Enterococcus raffinosus]MDT2522902.1 hypothetical protein [Enterococcus raffinosus]MDT2532411.1 hypothetical protein [Enterococcus raffinosus]MDT2590246.1 hypothetical protein [Enterococcus raffinosus]